MNNSIDMRNANATAPRFDSVWDVLELDRQLCVDRDYDLYDTVYDVAGAVCQMDPDDDYSLMCIDIMKRIRVERVRYHQYSGYIVGEIEPFIRENYPKIREFGSKWTWIHFPENPDEDEHWHFEEDDQIYMAVRMIIDLLIGNFSDEAAADWLRIFQGVE